MTADADPEDILVITGSPTSMTTFEDLLKPEIPGTGVPQVTSLVVHATEVVNRSDDRAILSDAMRRELVQRFLEDHEWESDYLQRASRQDSFEADVAQLMETATWQDLNFESTAELAEIAGAVEGFHSWLAEHDHLERGQMIAQATEVLSDSGRRDEILDADALLVVEFEEFLEQDRQYLQALATDLKLVCIAERDASIRRAWTEPGPITNHVSFSEEEDVERTDPHSEPAATAAYLARGRVHQNPETGEVRVLAAPTANDELERVADEIERLRDRHDLAYDEFAVALKRSGTAVIETLRELQRAGIPTESATVTGFGDDPAIREVLQVVHYLADETDPEIGSLADDTDPETEVTSEGHVLDEDLLDEVAEMESLEDALRRWATESDLKTRIAADATPLEARTRFGNVRRVFTIADFLEDTDFLEPTWNTLATMLERAHEYAPQQNQTSAIERDGGVRVDHVRSLKNGSFEVVFLLNVVDEEYPGDPTVSRLFPREHVARMPDYPGVTDVSDAEVDATFETDSTRSGNPFVQYHAEYARRQLAVGASVADERLYVSLHEHEDTALDERVQPSRFLADAYRKLPWLTEAEEPEIQSERAAEEYLLSRVDRALADVRRSNSQDVTVALDDVEADLAEIDELLSNSGERGAKLREALRARVDFARGRVRRE